MDYNIGSSIKAYRKFKNLTVEKLADITFVDPSLITHVENGYKNFSFENTIKILNALEMTFDDCIIIKSERKLLIEKIKTIFHSDLCIDEQSYFYFVLKNLNSLTR